jgi:Mg2+/citrate symporter
MFFEAFDHFLNVFIALGGSALELLINSDAHFFGLLLQGQSGLFDTL